MTNTDGAAQGEWEWQRHDEVWSCGNCGELWKAHALADCPKCTSPMQRTKDLADHRKAQLVDVLAKALELISNPDRTVYPGGSYWELARAALAQFRAATEEATR